MHLICENMNENSIKLEVNHNLNVIMNKNGIDFLFQHSKRNLNVMQNNLIHFPSNFCM